ncbi:MAG TPA: DUF2157 domain-containing protein [Elusimicrobiota bacterium]|nr:DUF2157 domain-containing protein [Elusimicrobiota bacterium]
MSFIASWRERGLLKNDQAELLSRIEDGRLFSVSAELRALLYIGALFLIGGIGATVQKRVDLGPAAIAGLLALGVAACAWYCLARAKPYSDEAVESPTLAFDYVLYLGCALLGILFGYLETKFHLLAEHWDYYLLGSGALFTALAYRFDNRLALATGLLNAGAWFGIRPERWDVPHFGLRSRAVLFGALLLAAARATHGGRIKRHFRDSYGLLGLHVLACALLSGMFEKGALSAYTPVLAALVGAAVYVALELRGFEYFLSAAAYGYVGLSYCVLKQGRWDGGAASLYFLVSSTAMAALVFSMRRRLERKQ